MARQTWPARPAREFQRDWIVSSSKPNHRLPLFEEEKEEEFLPRQKDIVEELRSLTLSNVGKGKSDGREKSFASCDCLNSFRVHVASRPEVYLCLLLFSSSACFSDE
jgi:hypothetical protein